MWGLSSAGDGRKVKQMSIFRSLGFFCMFAEMETLTKAEIACELRNPLGRGPSVSKSILLNISFVLRCGSVLHPATEQTEAISILKDSGPLTQDSPILLAMCQFQHHGIIYMYRLSLSGNDNEG